MPGGEDVATVAARAKAVIGTRGTAGGDVLCFGHGHALRVLTAVALELDPGAGARFALDPATINIVGDERGERALRAWNERTSTMITVNTAPEVKLHRSVTKALKRRFDADRLAVARRSRRSRAGHCAALGRVTTWVVHRRRGRRAPCW